MKTQLSFTIVLIFTVLTLISQSVIGQVKMYPTPLNAVTSAVFSLKADGSAVYVNDYMDYHYVHFELSGTTTIEVTAPENISTYTVSPVSLGIVATVLGNKLTFNIVQNKTDHETPSYLIVQINNLEKLVILADRPETDVPQASGSGIYNVRNAAYNADSTGVSSAQSAIQKAIDDATNAGGGIVYVPYGLYQIKENLTLKSNVSLYIEAGAVLKSIENRNEYPLVAGIEPAVIIHNAKNVKIYGRGEINASGFAIMNPILGFTEQSVEHPRRRVIETDNSQNIILNGILVKDGTGWTVELKLSDTAVVQNVKVLNHKDINYKIQNDGINATSSSNTLVNQCFVMTIDDAMCSKSRYNGTMKNCTFSNNVIYSWSSGVKAGMQSTGNMVNIVFRNCDVVHARRGVGIDTREGYKPIAGVVFNDIRVEELEPTSGGGDYAIEFATELAPVDNITVRRVTCTTNNKIRLAGLFDLTNIKFEGIELNNKLVMSNAMANASIEPGINVTYSYDSVFTDDIVYDSTYSDISSGWTGAGLINNGIKNDVASNSATEAWIEYSYTEALDIYKARVNISGNTGTTWMIKYWNDTSTVWSNAFPDAVTLIEGWNNKTFYASASKIRFYFYNAAGNININEIQGFADIVAIENNGGADSNKCLLIEPEDLSGHKQFAPFYVAADATACNGSYVVSDTDGDLNLPSSTGVVNVDFYVDSAARYNFLLRVIALGTSDDSFWVIVDGDAVKYNLIKASTEWIWVEAPKSYDLTKGLHNLKIVNRESNTKLDQILISTSANLPTGCSSCGNKYDPSIIYYTLKTSAVGLGSISLDRADGVYVAGTSVTLTAIPAKGYFFDGWSGDTLSTTNPLQVVMDKNKSIAATFRKIETSNARIFSNNEINGQIQIYPNPANNVLFFNIEGQIEGTITLYGINGIAVRKQYIGQKNTISTSNLPEGLYMIQYISVNGKVKYSQSLYITH